MASAPRSSCPGWALRLVAAVLLLAGAAVCQDPPTAPPPGSQELAADPLALPFPSFDTPLALATWATQTRLAAVRKMAAARAGQDEAEVARILLRLELVKLHAFRELERLAAAPR